MIVVAGGTGTLGTPLVACLAEAGLAVRVLTRDPARAQHLGPGVDVARGDVRDPASLGPALRGAGTVISAVHGLTGPGGISPASVDRAGNANLVPVARAGGLMWLRGGPGPEAPGSVAGEAALTSLGEAAQSLRRPKGLRQCPGCACSRCPR